MLPDLAKTFGEHDDSSKYALSVVDIDKLDQAPVHNLEVLNYPGEQQII